jgi:molybdopterin molybdotransferase
MIPLAEARAYVLDGLVPLAAARVTTAEALGCVTTEAVVASQPVPAFANSAMDGYALRAADTTAAPARLQVVGAVMAGSSPEVTVGPGQAVRIMTGAPIPAGADAVCMVELTEPGDDGASVTIECPIPLGEYVREAGGDITAGQEVFPVGTVLTPGCIGVLASLGVADIAVHTRPRVGVLSTGDELSDEPAPLPVGKIRDANRRSLLALVAQSGFVGIDLGVIPDDEAALAQALTDGAVRCDVLITSGGVSVGDRDVVKAVLSELADPVRWMQGAIRPAKPFTFGRLGPTRIPVFGLPGNPVSAMVSFELFTRPTLRRLAGRRSLDRPIIDAIVDHGISRRPDGKLHLDRVVAAIGSDGRVHVREAGGQSSHQLHAMAVGNALALVPDGDGIPAGGQVATMLLDAGEMASPAGEHLL